MKYTLLDQLDATFAVSLTICLPRRWSKQFNCFFPPLLDVAGEVAEVFDRELEKVGYSASIIRKNKQ